MKRLAYLLPLFACATPLQTLPPSDTYTMVERPAPQLNSEEQRLVADINKELDRLGLPQATVGGYECNVAAVMANVGLAKIWHGSGRRFPTDSDVAVAPTKAPETPVKPDHTAGPTRLTTLTDEEDDADIKHVHQAQHETSYGIPVIRATITTTPLAQTSLTLDSDRVQKIVRQLKPDAIRGELRLGVAVLPVADADDRIWVIVLHDRVFDVTSGPPRFAAPGARFEVAGTVVPPVTKVQLGLLGPDGKTQLLAPAVDASGHFESTVRLPQTPGIYTFSLEPGEEQGAFLAPLFVGVDAAPWPPSADPKATPLDGTRSVAQRLAKTIADYRSMHGFKPVPFDAKLSSFAKEQATALAALVDEASGPGAVGNIQRFDDSFRDRAKTAGYVNIHWHYGVWSDEYINDYFARYPGSPFLAAQLGSPSLESIGIGVALVPNTVTKDDDLTRYVLIVTTNDPTPPHASEADSEPEASPAAQKPSTTP